MDRQFGDSSLDKLKVIITVDHDEEVALVKELCSWKFFGLNPNNLIIINEPRFPGFINIPGSEQMKKVGITLIIYLICFV